MEQKREHQSVVESGTWGDIHSWQRMELLLLWQKVSYYRQTQLVTRGLPSCLVGTRYTLGGIVLGLG